MIASFGDITFEVPLAPESIDHSQQARYAQHEVVGGKPRLERTGEEAETISFGIRLRRRWMDRVINVGEVLETLRAKAEDGGDERLLLGDETLGRYVLESVEITYQRAHSGRIWSATADLSFTEYN